MASSKGHVFIGHPSHAEQIAIIDELLARRAAEVKPIKLPDRLKPVEGEYCDDIHMVKDDSGYYLSADYVIEAIKAAGGTIEE